MKQPMPVTFAQCRPHPTMRGVSSYTVLGFMGYLIANVVGAMLAHRWGLQLGERLIAFFAPAVSFIAVVTVSKVLLGRERIVFYQTTLAGIVAVVVLGLLTGARVARLLDLVTLGIGTFLVFGRIGCHAVACCHGTLGRGVIYGAEHVAVGFWPRWSGRPLWPVQLVEAAGSGALVLAGVAASALPGRAALVYTLGYAGVRFVLELVRGDGARPYALGVTEAQWLAVATAIACAAWRIDVFTSAFAATLAASAAALIAFRRRREFLFPPHLLELDRAFRATSDRESHETSLGVRVSRHVLPDGRTDWILSSTHRRWSETAVRRLAHRLWLSCEIIPGRTAGVFHVLTE
jgi:prolipoprotein diacylglyceryltransferase